MYICICMYYFITNFVCHVQKCQPIYKKQDVFLNKLYFGFFQIFKDSKCDLLRNKCLVFDGVLVCF